MPFKHGRLTEILHGTATTAQDVSAFFYSAQFNTYLNTSEVSTFKSTYKSYIAGEAFSQFFGYGYYDPTLTAPRLSLQAAPGVLNYAPAGATAIGDHVRLINFNAVDYKESPKTTGAIPFAWSCDSTLPVGFGTCLAILAPSTGTGAFALYNGGGGDGIGNAGLQTTTGLVAHLHVTAMTGGDTIQAKLQDATTIGGVYADIAGGSFVNVTAVGAQRLVVPGTIRQFVRFVWLLTAGHTVTLAVAAART